MEKRIKMLKFLENLIDKPLCTAKKSPDTELYEFVFGEPICHTAKFKNNKNETYVLHVLCEFEILFRKEKKSQHFDGNTSYEEFQNTIDFCLNKLIKRVTVNENNQLWFDFGDVWFVFIPLENEEESWRFFEFSEGSHLIVSNNKIEF